MISTTHIEVPADGTRIVAGEPTPDNPIIPFIEGDGIGVDITPAMQLVVDAAVEKAYGGGRQIQWMEIYAGEKATRVYGSDVWLPDETLEAAREYSVSIKGPMTTPVGGGIRSLNVALRQQLDLFVCLRPVRHFPGVPSPLEDPSKTDMVIFRENTEDIYAGIEWEAELGRRQEGDRLPPGRDGRAEDPLPGDLEHRDQARLERGHRAAGAQGDRVRDRERARLGHARAQGEHHEVHRGRLPRLGLCARPARVRRDADRRRPLAGTRARAGRTITIKDVIADAFLQQILTRPAEYDVIATLNLNGDYISDALAAQVGGIGIAPGGNLSDDVAMFEATHGTAPKYAGQDKVNPGSLILSAEMMLRHIGWVEAADLIISSLGAAISDKQVTYDFARLMDGANEISTSAFAQAMVDRM